MYSFRFLKDVTSNFRQHILDTWCCKMVYTDNLDTNPRVRYHRKTTQSVPKNIFHQSHWNTLLLKHLRTVSGWWFMVYSRPIAKSSQWRLAGLPLLTNRLSKQKHRLSPQVFKRSTSYDGFGAVAVTTKPNLGSRPGVQHHVTPGPAVKQAQENVALSLAKSQQEKPRTVGRIGRERESSYDDQQLGDCSLFIFIPRVSYMPRWCRIEITQSSTI